MREIHIKDFVEKYSQGHAAEVIGCTQGAVSKMLKAERDIYFSIKDSGEISYYELKKPGRKSVA